MSRIVIHGAKFMHVPNALNCVYLCELTNGLVKVGFTNAPRRRLTGLSRGLVAVGAAIARFEIFQGNAPVEAWMRDPDGNERRAIAALRLQAAPVVGTHEYFPLPFDVALPIVAAAVTTEQASV